MTSDMAFEKSIILLQKAIDIWENKIKDKYELAERYYQQAVAIRDEHFPDKKEILTDDMCPF